MDVWPALRWYLTLQLVGLSALPLALRLFRHLPGRGYAFARPLGLLVGGWVFWLLLTFGWLPNTAGAVLVALALVAAFGVALWLRPSSQSAPVSWRHVLLVEILFAASFAAWCAVRAFMPRIETAGGEKWMEIAFLNAILRAPRFPPQDPWLSGFGISYYYFGYVMVAMLVRVARVVSTVGFNLGIATLFALTCTGAYGLVYALLARLRRWQADFAAFLGPLLVAITGNLEGLLEVLHARGLFSASFWRWLDIRSINVAPPSLADGSWLPTRHIWWWQASRVLHDYAPWHTVANPAEWEVIDEFPAFSFLLGDMHPHLLALPFALLALALALTLVLRSPEPGRLKLRNLELPLSGWELMTFGLCLGGLGFLNTWDLPIYLAVALGAFAVGSRRQSGFDPGVLLVLTPLLGLACFVPYLPFWVGLRSQASGISPNLFNGTFLPQVLVMFGPLLAPVTALVVSEARRRQVRASTVVLWVAILLLGLTAFVVVAGLVSPEGRRYLVAWREGTVPGLEHIPDAPLLVAQRMRDRLLQPWTSLALSALLAAAVLVLLRKPRSESGAPAGEHSAPAAQDAAVESETSYVVLLVAAGAVLTLAVEFVYLRDIFGTRMNTVFKFYFQTWLLWGVAGAYGLARLRAGHRTWSAVLTTLAVLAVVAGLVYLPLAIVTRARESGGPPTLDGAAHLRDSYPEDFAAIDWLNRNVEGTPVILEAPADQGGAYRYEGRVSAFTGLPTLLGWGGHQLQWRGSYDEPSRREPAIERLYMTTDWLRAYALLDEYGVEYVYVGPVERERYPAAGLAKFAEILDVVYDSDDVTIYRYRAASPVRPGREAGPEPRQW